MMIASAKGDIDLEAARGIENAATDTATVHDRATDAEIPTETTSGDIGREVGSIGAETTAPSIAENAARVTIAPGHVRGIADGGGTQGAGLHTRRLRRGGIECET
jgi:hypothetical protein